MRRVISIFLVAVFAAFLSGEASATLLFTDNFEGDLSAWTGKNQGVHSGAIVSDPLNSTQTNKVLHFTSLVSYGDIFTRDAFHSQASEFLLTFDYLGMPNQGGKSGDLGGFIGYSYDFPGAQTWVASTSRQYPHLTQLVDDGMWHTYEIRLPNSGDIHLMLEDWRFSGGVAGDAYFDNIALYNPERPGTAPVPEPATMLLLGSGLVGLGFGRFRKRRK